MMKQPVEKALNEQVNAELYSAYLYLAMAAALEEMGLPGFANWMRVQTQEETSHAMKIFDHIVERSAKVTLTAIDTPPSGWSDVMAMFQDVLKHEQSVTERINALVDLAIKEKDHASNMFLQWFVTEQVEEEKSAEDLIVQLKHMKDAPGGMMMLDRELGRRVFTAPAAE